MYIVTRFINTGCGKHFYSVTTNVVYLMTYERDNLINQAIFDSRSHNHLSTVNRSRDQSGLFMKFKLEI